MSNEKSRHDIYDRIFNFIVEVLRFIDRLPKTYSNQIIIGQATRSVTSMGANSQEADGTSTRKDFIHCLTIVRKESKETVYWLKLIEKLNSRYAAETFSIVSEGNEIVAIVSTIIKNTLANSKSS
jgi:four helix bundle protein